MWGLENGVSTWAGIRPISPSCLGVARNATRGSNCTWYLLLYGFEFCDGIHVLLMARCVLLCDQSKAALYEAICFVG